jgi:hypothetical protein
MGTAKLARITGTKPRSWQDAVDEYVRTHWAPSVR